MYDYGGLADLASFRFLCILIFLFQLLVHFTNNTHMPSSLSIVDTLFC